MNDSYFHTIPLPSTNNFTNLSTPEEVLKIVFGHDEFRDLQKKIIEDFLNKKNVLAILPTGAGKTLCFQIPSLLTDGTTIVISPLLSLMRDQVNRARKYGIMASALVSDASQSRMEKKEIEDHLIQGTMKLIYVSPERFMSTSFTNLMSKTKISSIVIDEAHCMCEWGNEFRPDYLNIADVIKNNFDIPVMALTASAGKEMRSYIVSHLFNKKHVEHVGSFKRPHIGIAVKETSNLFDSVVKYVKFETKENENKIIYCKSRKDVDELDEILKKQGLNSKPFHAGLPDDLRKETQEKFFDGSFDLMVCTTAFGMGVDKPDIRHVIHCGLPQNIESYYQESGRAGRDRIFSKSMIFWTAKDIATRTSSFSMMQDDKKYRELSRFEQVMGFVEAPCCRNLVISRYFDENDNEECGVCDICLSCTEIDDQTELTTKIISLVKRISPTRKSSIIDILSGSHGEKIISKRYDKYPEYGIMKKEGSKIIGKFLRKCIGYGLFSIDHSNGCIQINQKKEAVLFKTVKKAEQKNEILSNLTGWRQKTIEKLKKEQSFIEHMKDKKFVNDFLKQLSLGKIDDVFSNTYDDVIIKKIDSAFRQEKQKEEDGRSFVEMDF